MFSSSVVLAALVFLGLPIVGLALALIAYARTDRLHREIHGLQDQLAALRGELRTLREQGVPVRPAWPAAPAPAVAAPPTAAPAPTPEAAPPSAPSPPLAPAPPPAPLPPPAPPPAVPPGPILPHRPAPAAPAQGLEERLGTRLFTWLGSIALFLAGAYLVKFTFDQ
ncbi:MAG: hypothetical protein H6Q01_1195, partial [Acidobacteria bacterium]|nr:hypothetical protein [Acidobacteriota bacterium]